YFRPCSSFHAFGEKDCSMAEYDRLSGKNRDDVFFKVLDQRDNKRNGDTWNVKHLALRKL
ncbi:unnamed protein product, partial [Fusarium graminearum]